MKIESGAKQLKISIIKQMIIDFLHRIKQMIIDFLLRLKWQNILFAEVF